MVRMENKGYGLLLTEGSNRKRLILRLVLNRHTRKQLYFHQKSIGEALDSQRKSVRSDNDSPSVVRRSGTESKSVRLLARIRSGGGVLDRISERLTSTM
jgi:hypothetical protein